MQLENVSDLVGHTLSAVEKKGEDELVFTLEDGVKYRLFHQQDCCESVEIEDIAGDLSDLVGFPILKAEESVSSGGNHKICESHTWTFYHFATIKGYVTVRWYGSSNGYYSESVDFAACE